MGIPDGDRLRREAAAEGVKVQLDAVDRMTDPSNMSPDHIDDRLTRLLAQTGLGEPVAPTPSVASLEEMFGQ